MGDAKGAVMAGTGSVQTGSRSCQPAPAKLSDPRAEGGLLETRALPPPPPIESLQCILQREVGRWCPSPTAISAEVQNYSSPSQDGHRGDSAGTDPTVNAVG